MAEVETNPCAVCEQPMLDPSMTHAIFGAHASCLDSPADIWIDWPRRPPNDAWFYTVESKPASGIKYTRHDLHDEHSQQRIERLEGALREAKRLIRLNARDEAQDDAAWKRYQANSPAMKLINAELKEEE